jgi:hypothetical protein
MPSFLSFKNYITKRGYKVATKSIARKTIEKLLSEATTPEQRADYATRLAKIAHNEGVERSRRRRAKAAKPKPETPMRDDSDDIFELEVYPAVLTTPKVDIAKEAAARAELLASSAPVIVDEPEDAPQQNGYSREVECAGDWTFEEEFPTARFHDQLTYVDPLGFLGTPGVLVDTYVGGRSTNDIDAEQKERAEQEWKEMQRTRPTRYRR